MFSSKDSILAEFNWLSQNLCDTILIKIVYVAPKLENGAVKTSAQNTCALHTVIGYSRIILISLKLLFYPRNRYIILSLLEKCHEMFFCYIEKLEMPAKIEIPTFFHCH